GISLLAHFISRRVAGDDFSSWALIKQIAWARLCIILVLFDSWLFVGACTALIFGAGLETQISHCSDAIYLCIAFYATSKILTYFFLVEKVHVVWSPAARASRLNIYTLVILAMILGAFPAPSTEPSDIFKGQIHFFRENDLACVIGLKVSAAIPLLDIRCVRRSNIFHLPPAKSSSSFVNLCLTGCFVYLLVRSHINNPRMKAVARRNSMQINPTWPLFTLLTSFHLFSILVSIPSHPFLGLCSLDVIVNATVLFWLTSGSTRETGST
ncbi:hypothetical protein C8J56DRAFT_740129, partial [Mycena floridula]